MVSWPLVSYERNLLNPNYVPTRRHALAASVAGLLLVAIQPAHLHDSPTSSPNCPTFADDAPKPVHQHTVSFGESTKPDVASRNQRIEKILQSAGKIVASRCSSPLFGQQFNMLTDKGEPGTYLTIASKAPEKPRPNTAGTTYEIDLVLPDTYRSLKVPVHAHDVQDFYLTESGTDDKGRRQDYRMLSAHRTNSGSWQFSQTVNYRNETRDSSGGNTINPSSLGNLYGFQHDAGEFLNDCWQGASGPLPFAPETLKQV